ncbi:MAG: hypothetical protein BWY95_01758 [Bacteroidetes bacterium ADurb.BinA104]|nr:MAG: hypothetical protein BWY95_01758 [Bacteroidetes bacterium ADurb.BinA104]
MSFTAVISANIKDFESNLQKAQNQMDAFDKKIGVSVASIGRAVEGVGKKMSILSAALVVAGGKAFTMAADFQDAVGATDQIFNEASETVNNWAKNLSSDFGIAKEEALKYSNLMGSMLINIGQLTEEQAAKQSAKLIELAGDLTAMYGGTTQDAVRALTGALKGNNTMLDNYGMAVNDALVKQKAFELGLSSGTGELSLQAKQAATLALIWEQTGAAQGQAAREADEASGTMRALSVEIKNISTEIGEVLLPIITPIVAKIRDFVAALRDLDPKILEWGVKIAGVVAAIGPLLIMIGKVLQILPLIKVAIAALTGPVGLVVAAVSAAAVLIIKYWDEIKTFFINVANSVTQAIAKMAGNIAGLLERVGLDKMASKLRGFQQTMENAFIVPKPKVDDLESSVDEFGNTVNGTTTNVNGLAGGLGVLGDQAEETANAFEKLIAGMTVREAVQATTSAIEDLQSKIVKLQTGILPTSNLSKDLTEANKQLSELTAGLDLLTGGREINIDVKFNTQGIEAEENKFFKDGAFTLPEIDTSNLDLSLQKANELVIDYGSLISSGIGDIASAIGNAFAGNWDDLGADLIGAMGNLAQQFGSLLIASGVAAQSLQTLIANPLTAIAAGAALVALGSFATAQAKKMTQNATSLSGGTASYGNVNTGPQPGQSDYRGMYRDDWAGNVTFKIGNNELVGVLEQANKRNNRIG